MTAQQPFGSPNWHPASWRDHPASQQPSWAADPADAVRQLSSFPALVFAGEARRLTQLLADAGRGEAFVLQAGDCSEAFSDFTAPNIREKLRIILQMTVILAYSTGLPVVKIGRMAGQFAKPRSSDTETVGDVTLPSFRGHMVNGDEFTARARAHDPSRMVEAYFHSAATLNLVRAFTTGGFASLQNVQKWNQEFLLNSPTGARFSHIADGISRALSFMAACGVDPADEAFSQAEVFTSHEALVLDYEQALCRRDSLTDVWYDTSAHMLWIGERTREPLGAHVEFLSGVANPLGVKLGPSATPADVEALCEKLNPRSVPGRLSFITRMGADKLPQVLPPLVEACRGKNVTWLCDPMHANGRTTDTGVKTRHMEDIAAEVAAFFSTMRSLNTPPAGLHIELTGDNVTECLGGPDGLTASDLGDNYTSTCDPRLNARQSLDLAFQAADLLTNTPRFVRDDESGELVAVPTINSYPIG